MKLANATLFIGVCGVDGSAATRGSIAYLPGGSDGNARAPPPPANVTRVNLDANTESVSAAIDTGLLAGAVTLVWQDGAVRQVNTLGHRDVDARLPMERDTVFRIASMSKPVTVAAAMTLVDEGRIGGTVALDSTYVKAHRSAAGAQKKRAARKLASLRDRSAPCAKVLRREPHTVISRSGTASAMASMIHLCCFGSTPS